MFRSHATVQRCAATNHTPGGPALGRTKDCRASNSRLSTKAVAKMVSVGIVGAGFSGLCMAIKLQKAGLTNFTVYEAADDIGGTWRANRYPGCACDIQSVMYCYSFEPYPWTQHYSAQPEILEYLHHCADKYALWDHIQLNTQVTGASFNEDRAVWCIRTHTGQQQEVNVLVLAQGPLSMPLVPQLPGLSGFKGSILHTAAWDSSIDLAGKKVVVVGTGASAIQVVPQLQKVARELTIFQRTPGWVLPRKELMPKYAVPAARHGSGLTLWLQRVAAFWQGELLLGTALVGNRQGLLKKIEAMSVRHMKRAVKDPKLRQQLIPDYSVGCKRILGSDDYYPALAQPNVHLVASGLKEILPDGSTLVAQDDSSVSGVDAIVFATGFNVKAPLSQFDIRARGQDLRQLLSVNPEGYYGLAIAGFPNLFTMIGPNTGLGHSSVVFMAECQVNLILQLISRYVLRQGLHCVEVLPEAQQQLNREIQRRLQGTVWLSGCDSWYLTTADAAAAAAPAGGHTDGTPGSTGGSNERGSRPGQGDRDNGSSGAGGGRGQRSGGIVLWPGLCVEYWWRTLWPMAAHWRASKAVGAAAVGDGAGVAGGSTTAAAADSKKGM